MSSLEVRRSQDTDYKLSMAHELAGRVASWPPNIGEHASALRLQLAAEMFYNQCYFAWQGTTLAGVAVLHPDVIPYDDHVAACRRVAVYTHPGYTDVRTSLLANVVEHHGDEHLVIVTRDDLFIIGAAFQYQFVNTAHPDHPAWFLPICDRFNSRERSLHRDYLTPEKQPEIMVLYRPPSGLS